MRSLNSKNSTPNLRPTATVRVPVILTTPPCAQKGKPPQNTSTSPAPSTIAPATPSLTGSANNSLATRRPHTASAAIVHGHSRPSIVPSSSTRSQRPVTQTPALSSTTPSRAVLSQTSPTAITNITRPPSRASSTTTQPAIHSADNTLAANSRGTPALRAPLFNRDNNARGGGMTRSTKTFTATMAPEKGPNANARQTPSLAKGLMGRSTPLTPKIATPTGQPRIAQATATTPLARRTQHGVGQTREEPASPAPPFLNTNSNNNNNITPRSGTRQSRVDSAHNSPSGTPIPDRSDGWDARAGLAGPGTDVDAARRAGALSPSNDASRDAQAAADTKFFYASDARGGQPRPAPAPQPRSGGNFFYASGGAVENKQNPHAPATSSPALQDNRSSRYMYASGVPNLAPPYNPSGNSRPSSVVSGASRPTIGRLNQGTQPPSSAPQHQRPASPVKTTSHPALSHWSSQQPPPMPSRPNSFIQSPQIPAKRRVSVENAPPRSHSRSGSLSNTGMESPPPSKGIPAVPSSEISTPGSVSSPTMTLASPLQPVEERVAAAESNPETPLYSGIHSPTKPSNPNDPLSELIANARRDRKVQDLEITNTSLTAINRSLERRLRKQTAELRRYRRLSRAGRLSLGSTLSSTLPRDSLTSETGTDGLDLTDLSEEEIDLSEEESELSESDSGSESLSPEARAARDARHRQKDERRLEVDLAKHRELLVDSQKINQSLKNCINWTEELIKDGRKALAYQVRVSDIKLGGRILAPDDDDDDDEGDDDGGDDDDGVEDSERGDDTIQGLCILPENTDVPWAKEPQDRDSGVEFPPDVG